MAGMNFEYDERGGTFYYFLVSFYALILIPATYYLWPRGQKKKDNAPDAKICRCQPCLVKDSWKRSREPFKKWKTRIIKLIFILFWVGFVALTFKAAQIETDHVEWDPYAVLGLDRGASVEEVKKAYRQLTKIHHPDKGGDEKRFVEVTKAHLALTDEESKKNYDLYGNPDGPGAQTFGIALPSWLVSKEYGFFVLAAYGLVFMIILPVGVGVWWYKSIRYSADSVLMKTTELFAHMEHKTSFLNVKRVITIISGACEFWKIFNKEIVERPSDDVEVPNLLKHYSAISENKRERPFFMPYSIKARALLYAHLSRRPLPPETLNKDLHYILKKSSFLLQELIQVHIQLYMYASAGRVMRCPALESLDNIMKISPMLVQSIWESKSPLLQLPHIDDDILRRFIIRKKRNLKTCASLAALNNEERREVLRCFTDRQYLDIMVVLASMPHVEMEIVLEVKDDEDKTITAGALTTAVIKLKRTPLLDLNSIKNLNYSHQPSILTSRNQSDGLEKSSYDALINNHQTSVLDEESDFEKVDDEHNDNETDDVKPSESPSIQNSIQPAVKSKNVWEKNKKKKGGKNKAKTKAQNQKKYQQQQQQQQQQKKQLVTKKADVVTKKEDEAETDNEHSAPDSNEDDSSSDGEDAKECIKNAKALEAEEDAAAAEDEDFLLDEEFTRKERMLEAKSKITHLVHAPFYPEEKYEWWWLYICDRKNRQLVCPPIRVTTLINEEEVELRFPAPKIPGTYSLQVCLRSDSYADCDVNKDIKYTVAEAKQITSHPQWEFPEDGEDDKKSGAGDLASDDENLSEYTEEEEDVSD